MNNVLSPSLKALEYSKNLCTRISDRKRLRVLTMRSWAFLKEYKRPLLLPFVIVMIITVLLLSLAVWMHEPVIAQMEDAFVLGCYGC
jgi:hypothetical protein